MQLKVVKLCIGETRGLNATRVSCHNNFILVVGDSIDWTLSNNDTEALSQAFKKVPCVVLDAPKSIPYWYQHSVHGCISM